MKGANDLKVELWLSGKLSGNRKRNDSVRITAWAWRYVLEQANYSCEECGWNERHPIDGHCLVEVDHKDGNKHNSSRENLRALCPNCHAKTPFHNGRNKGTYAELGQR